MSKKDKIDTQGMTGPTKGTSGLMFGKPGKMPEEAGEMPVVRHRMLPKNESLYMELKELINEVLDEREARSYSNSTVDSVYYDNL